MVDEEDNTIVQERKISEADIKEECHSVWRNENNSRSG